MPAVVVLAGQRQGAADPVAQAAEVAAKALADIGGETMLARVVTAVRGAGVERVLVSATHAGVIAEAERLGAEPVVAAGGPSDSVAAAFAVTGAPLLVATADHPLLTPAWVEGFIADVPAGTDVAVLLARRDLVEAALPGTRRTWLRFRDGDWSGCNLFLLASPRAAAALSLWREVETNRKRPWRIVRRLGPATLARYLLGRLTLADALARLGRQVGITAAVVAARDGLAAVDVDSEADYLMVRSLLAARSAAG